MKYRQYFGLSYEQFASTPPQVFFSDLEMIDLESKNEKYEQKKLNSKIKK